MCGGAIVVRPIISVQNLTKRYHGSSSGGKTALRDLTLDVPPGEIFGFLGPNGAGKTTAIKLLLGLITPTAGGGTILGHPLGSVDGRRRLGFLPESPYFYEYLRGPELLRYYGRLSGLAAPQCRHRAEMLLRQVGLWDSRHLHVRKYSRGMLQRLGLAQALIHDPELVVLDEPAGGLDPIGRREMRDMLLQLREQGKTIFLSSHILAEVETVCDRVAILHHGQLVATGRIGDLLGAGHEMELTVRGVNGALAGSLAGLPGVEIHHGTETTVVLLREQDLVHRSMEIVRNAGGQVVSLVPKRERLEDLFVRLVGASKEDQR